MGLGGAFFVLLVALPPPPLPPPPPPQAARSSASAANRASRRRWLRFTSGTIVAAVRRYGSALRFGATVRRMARREVIEADRVLAEHHPAFRPIIERAGPCDLRRGRPRRTHFAELVRAVCYQQLAGPAARAIHGRV